MNVSACNLQIKSKTGKQLNGTCIRLWFQVGLLGQLPPYLRLTHLCVNKWIMARGGSLGDLPQICSTDNVWERGRNLQCTVLSLLWVLPFIHMFIQPLNIYGEPTPCWALSFSPLQGTPAQREIRRALQVPCPPQQWSAVGKAAWFQILPLPVTCRCLSFLICAMGKGGG